MFGFYILFRESTAEIIFEWCFVQCGRKSEGLLNVVHVGFENTAYIHCGTKKTDNWVHLTAIAHLPGTRKQQFSFPWCMILFRRSCWTGIFRKGSRFLKLFMRFKIHFLQSFQLGFAIQFSTQVGHTLFTKSSVKFTGALLPWPYNYFVIVNYFNFTNYFSMIIHTDISTMGFEKCNVY